MSRIARISSLFVLVAACECAPASPPVPVEPPKPTVAVEPPKPPPPPVDVSTPPKPEWDPASLTPAELKSIDRYAGFSFDSLAFAHATPSAGAGVDVLSFLSATTNTVERSVALADDASRKKAAAELSAGGFPRPGAAGKVPPILTTVLDSGKAQVFFSGMPACAPFGPAAGEGTVKAAKLIAVSPTGKLVAVELDIAGTGEFGSGKQVRVVTLFE